MKARVVIRTVLLLLTLAGGCVPQNYRESGLEEQIRRFLRLYLLGSELVKDETAGFSYSPISLSDDKSEELVVYVRGRSWCGTGGCLTLVLKGGSPYQIVGRVSITRLPIRALHTRSHGWRDLTVFVHGGGISKGYSAVLPFNGRSYPGNPSMAPARPIRASQSTGETILSSKSRIFPLFP